MLKLRIQYLDGSGNPVGEGEWPVVAAQLPGNLPMPEGFDKPIAPGETRRWEWTTGDMPDGWAKKSKAARLSTSAWRVTRIDPRAPRLR
jgi:hypothetical protein